MTRRSVLRLAAAGSLAGRTALASGLPDVDPKTGLDRDTAAALARLIAHRLDRESRVLAAVRSDARTPEEIVARAYDKDLTGVEEVARLAVEPHLEKLAVEGSVRWDARRASPA